MFKILKHITI